MQFSMVQSLFERYGGAKAERGIWYHGTSAKAARNIVKQGLLAHPKTKPHDEDSPVYSGQADRTLLNGVRLTQSLDVAMGSAYRAAKRDNANQALVIVVAQPRSLFADEGDFSKTITPVANDERDPNTAHYYWEAMRRIADDYVRDANLASQYWMALKNANDPGSQKFIEKSRSQYIDRVLAFAEQKLGDTLNPKLEKRLREIAEHGWELAVNRMTAYFPKERGNDWKEQWNRNWSKYSSTTAPSPPNAEQAEKDFAAYSEQISRSLKGIVGVHPLKSGKSPKDITFSGSNKIVAVIELVPGDDHVNRMKVLYGTIPEEFKREWKSYTLQMFFPDVLK